MDYSIGCLYLNFQESPKYIKTILIICIFPLFKNAFDSRSLASATPSILSPHWYPLAYSIVALLSLSRSCSFESACLAFSCAPAVSKWGWCWSRLTQPSFRAWVVARLVSLLAFSHCHQQSKLSSTDPASSSTAALNGSNDSLQRTLTSKDVQTIGCTVWLSVSHCSFHTHLHFLVCFSFQIYSNLWGRLQGYRTNMKGRGDGWGQDAWCKIHKESVINNKWIRNHF